MYFINQKVRKHGAKIHEILCAAFYACYNNLNIFVPISKYFSVIFHFGLGLGAICIPLCKCSRNVADGYDLNVVLLKMTVY